MTPYGMWEYFISNRVGHGVGKKGIAVGQLQRAIVAIEQATRESYITP